MLHSLKGDANCSSSTKYVSKLVKDFLDEQLEKKYSHSEIVHLPPHEDFILVEFFNTSVPSSADVQGIVSLGIKTFFAQKG